MADEFDNCINCSVAHFEYYYPDLYKYDKELAAQTERYLAFVCKDRRIFKIKKY